jgi:excisionase family DNA binding protein
MENELSPLALRPKEAARLLGISVRHLRELTKRGTIPCVRPNLGRRSAVLYPVELLREWLRGAAQFAPQVAPGQGGAK